MGEGSDGAPRQRPLGPTITDFDAYAEHMADLVARVLRAEIDRPDFKAGMGSEALHLFVLGDLDACGVSMSEATEAERRFVRWVSNWDQPTIGAFLTLARRLAQIVPAPSEYRADQ